MLVLRSVAAWLLILALAVLNGMFREAVLAPSLSKPAAYLLSGLLLSSFILVVAVALEPWLRPGSAARCLFVGFLWLCLTLVFEFGFGAVVQGRSREQMLEAYTFKDGNIWPLVLVVTFVSPLLASRVRGSERGARDRGV
jgi:hypothetical protein